MLSCYPHADDVQDPGPEDGWTTLRRISRATSLGENQAGTAMRSLTRKDRGGYTWQKRKIGDGSGMREYRLIRPVSPRQLSLVTLDGPAAGNVREPDLSTICLAGEIRCPHCGDLLEAETHIGLNLRYHREKIHAEE